MTTTSLTLDPQEEGYRLVTTKLGMWVFLAMEMLFFGTLFFLYGSERKFFPQAFALGSEHLETMIAAINTALLLTSSFAVASSIESLKRGARGKTIAWLAATFVLGLGFVALKAYEYKLDFDHALVPRLNFHPDFAHTPELELFFGLYFLATSLHALHVLIGLTWIAVITWGVRRGFTTESRLESLGLYWHFVDVVWIFLFPLFYLIGGSP